MALEKQRGDGIQRDVRNISNLSRGANVPSLRYVKSCPSRYIRTAIIKEQQYKQDDALDGVALKLKPLPSNVPDERKGWGSQYQAQRKGY